MQWVEIIHFEKKVIFVFSCEFFVWKEKYYFKIVINFMINEDVSF